MQIDYLRKIKLPEKPGVYFFKKGREILYIGKATSLRDRVRSYFSNDLISTRGSRIIDMVTLSNSLTFQETDSVLEALLLESNLIKKHQPKYNIKEKDDKSYFYVVITKEEFPRVLPLRGKEIKHNLGLAKDLKIANTFGPFPNATQLKEALNLIKKLFPFFDTKQPINLEKNDSAINIKSSKKYNLNFQINLYPDVYSGKVSRTEYLENIKNIKLFFQGKKQSIVRNLKKQMREYSEILEFEKAEQIKKTLFAIDHIRDVSLIKEIDESSSDTDFSSDSSTGSQNHKNSQNSKHSQNLFRIESYDVAHISGTNTVGVMTVMEDGVLKKADYRKFNIKQAEKNDDYGALREILTRRLAHEEWPLPKMIVVDGGKGQLNVAKKVLGDLQDFIQIVAVVKDERHRAREILGGAKLSKNLQNKILLLNQDTHRFAIKFHREKRKVLK